MDGTIDGVIRFSARQVTGQQRRTFLALVCKQLCDGSARKAEERFGWGREAVARGLTSPIFENVKAARDAATKVPTILEISVDTKTKVSLGEYVLGGKN